jgi:hypothetical protein
VRGSRRSRESRVALAAAAVTAFVVVSFLVMSTSGAAFNGQTTNPANTVASGAVSLTDDDSDTAMFTISEAKPGLLAAECIQVNYTGTSVLSTPIKLYASGVPTGTLGAYLDLTVEEGTGGTKLSCAGFNTVSTFYTGTLDGFAAAHTGWASGADTAWTPAPGASHTFRFTLTLQDDNAAQGKSVGFGYTWEAQS